MWLVVVIISSAVVLLLCVVTCCAVRCFRPQNTRGPDWYVRKDGQEQIVKAPFRADKDQKTTRNWQLKGPGSIVYSCHTL